MGTGPRLKGVDYIEFYVDDAVQAAEIYSMALGLKGGPPTRYHVAGERLVSVLLVRNGIRFVLTSAEDADGAVAQHASRYGAGVRNVAFAVSDVEATFRHAVDHGAQPLRTPQEVFHGGRRVVAATIAAYGTVVHSLVEREAGDDWWVPDSRIVEHSSGWVAGGLIDIDHIATVVPEGSLDWATDLYVRALGFQEFLSEVVETEYSGMTVKAVRSPGGVTFTLIEPAPGMARCQLHDYLSRRGGAGVQHIALRSGDIIATIQMLSSRQVEFVPVPPTYYDQLLARWRSIDGDVSRLREFNVLVDRTEDGHLMQVFTTPLMHQDTGFFEIIERRGAQGFGLANIRTLFDAVEREQRLTQGVRGSDMATDSNQPRRGGTYEQ